MQEVFTAEEVAVYHYNLLLQWLQKMGQCVSCKCVPAYANEVAGRHLEEMLWFKSVLGLERVRHGYLKLLSFYFLTSKTSNDGTKFSTTDRAAT